MVLRGSPLITIVCEYNARRVLYFIVTEYTWSTKAGIHYLYNYPEKFSNVSIIPVSFPPFMYKFFGYVNDVNFHIKSSQSDLALEKFWVTHCGWLRSFTEVDMGITITNGWKLFGYGVKIY